jgi:hypothetical protein
VELPTQYDDQARIPGAVGGHDDGLHFIGVLLNSIQIPGNRFFHTDQGILTRGPFIPLFVSIM